MTPALTSTPSAGAPLLACCHLLPLVKGSGLWLALLLGSANVMPLENATSSPLA
jgi:hypothetical protein